MNMDGLVEYVIEIGPYDETPTLDTEDDTPPTPPEEDTEDDESIRENELNGSEDELKAEPLRREIHKRNPQLSMNPRKTQGKTPRRNG